MTCPLFLEFSPSPIPYIWAKAKETPNPVSAALSDPFPLTSISSCLHHSLGYCVILYICMCIVVYIWGWLKTRVVHIVWGYMGPVTWLLGGGYYWVLVTWLLGGIEVRIYWAGDSSHCSPDLSSSKCTTQYNFQYTPQCTSQCTYQYMLHPSVHLSVHLSVHITPLSTY